MTFCMGLAASPYWFFADLGLFFLCVMVEDDGGSVYHVIFEELVQLFHVKTEEV